VDTTAAPGLVPIYVRRARNGRLTGWIVQCETCTDVTPVLRSKSACIEQARMHGTRVHQRQCRIIAPMR
jgi:hypothetical protein